ncbi:MULTISPECIES: hypothetical protein [Photorhabdus]|uniref:Uncharacterized protein n=1 Tax=Photorhabdus thracensis TaxID=230089 RepID=A0A0F7LJB0_9GAMM|nr:hypothetical protein [Photorhabdus thracensis]AKH62163.1 hypothetical protein VY86_01075 [Photorhabdus thracensis]MCC8422249.1 hypothetical protein [Photorhabdus thracensis]
MIFHISLDKICYIREELIDRYGGLHGVVDIGRVDAVLYRIQALCEYEALTDLAPELVELTVLAETGDDVRDNIAKCFFQNGMNNCFL